MRGMIGGARRQRVDGSPATFVRWWLP